MRHGAWARRAGSFATRLVLAVLVTACLTAAGQSVLAGRLAARAVERDAVGHAVALAQAAGARVDDRAGDRTGATPDPARDRALLESVVADLGVAAGTVRVVDAPRGGQPQLTRTGAGADEQLLVTAPVGLPSGALGLQLTLDPAETRSRSAALRRSLLVVIGLGAVAAVPLVLVLGGRRLVRRYRDVVQLAGTDELTGAGNRRAFEADLEAAVAHARTVSASLAVVLAEVTGLSAVTTTVGRRRADGVLGEVAQVIEEHHPDRAYRIGGEVFAVLLPGTPPEDAFALADVLRAAVGDAAPPLTLSLGVAGLDDRCTDAATLVIAADAALDEARSLGGNRVVGPGGSTFGLRWVANRPLD